MIRLACEPIRGSATPGGLWAGAVPAAQGPHL